MHKTKLTKEQQDEVMARAAKGQFVCAAHDDEDNLTWVYINAKDMAIVLRTDGLVDVTFGVSFRGDGRTTRNPHCVEASFWLVGGRTEMEPHVARHLPEAYPGYVNAKVAAILAGKKPETAAVVYDEGELRLLRSALAVCGLLVVATLFAGWLL